MFHDVLSELRPIVAISMWLYIPEVELEFAFRKRRSLECTVGSFYLSNFHRGLHRCMINRLKNLGVDVKSGFTLECDAHLLEAVSQPLYSNPNRSMAHVWILCLRYWVVIAVNYFIKVFGNPLSDFMEVFIVELTSFVISKLWQWDRCQVADSHLVLVRIFNNLSAQVRAFDRSQVLLIRFSIASVFVKHVWGASFNLRIDDLAPKPLCFDSLSASSRLLIFSVKFLKFLSPAIKETWALIWTH